MSATHPANDPDHVHAECDPCDVPCEIPEGPDTCDTLFPWLEELQDCLCESLKASLGGPVCRCILVAGQQAAWDNCCQGQAWIRVESVFPSQSFPSPDTGAFRCGHEMMAATLELGVIRCAPSFDDDGNPPSIAAIEQSFRVVHSDRVRMLRAVTCCFDPQCQVVEIGAWQPLGESGGCVGGTMQLSISFNNCSCCCDTDLGHTADGDRCLPPPDPGSHVTPNGPDDGPNDDVPVDPGPVTPT